MKKPLRKKGNLENFTARIPMIKLEEDEEQRYLPEREIFKWAKISSNEYLVIMPPIFKKDSYTKFAIVSEKKFLKLKEIK